MPCGRVKQIELDVGGNHLVKNIKALFGLGVFLDDRRLEETARRLLARELEVTRPLIPALPR